MTTLSRMHQQILLTKLRLFVHRNRKRVTRKPIFVTTEVMRPRDTIARCYSVLSSSDKKTSLKPVGYEICISPIWLRRTVTQIEPWKMLMLHEIAHTSRLARGHDMMFKRTARRIGADYMARQACCFITK